MGGDIEAIVSTAVTSSYGEGEGTDGSEVACTVEPTLLAILLGSYSPSVILLQDDENERGDAVGTRGVVRTDSEECIHEP